MYGMMHRMGQAAQQSQARGPVTPASDASKTEHERFKAALEQMANDPCPVGYVLKALAIDALNPPK